MQKMASSSFQLFLQQVKSAPEVLKGCCRRLWVPIFQRLVLAVTSVAVVGERCVIVYLN